MANNTHSQDFRRFEETMKESMKQLFEKIQAQDETIAALNLKQNQVMAQMQQEQQGGYVQGNGPGGYRGGYFSTRQSKVDFPKFNGDDFSGWVYRCQ